MRQRHCTITPSLVRCLAHAALSRAWPWKPYGRLVSVRRLLDVLLLVAALRSSLSAVVRLFRFGFSHESARKAVRHNLPDRDRLTDGLLDALYALARHLGRRCWVVAIDLHYRPFYGDRHAPGVVGGQKKQGTKYFYAYATAVLVHKRHRYTVGLLACDGTRKPHQIVAALLAQLAAHGVRVRGVVLDAGFDSGETLLLLQEKHLSYVVPLRRKGQGNNRRNACFALPIGTRTEVSWLTEKTRRTVTTPAVVVWRAREKQVRLYAYGGWHAWRAVLQARAARRWYRARFGIETSYRQLNEVRGTTTKKDVCYRLLLIGVALLLRQAWVWLTWRIARDRGYGPRVWVWELPLSRLADWLADELQRKYKERKAIELSRPIALPDACKL
jgi:Transposase DDE domain